MPVADLAAPDSALFLWATFPQLPDALRLIEAWGFTYKSVAFVPAFLLAMYEKDGLPFEKVVRNIIRAKFLRPGIRAYRTENIYAPFAGPGAGKEDVIEKHKEKKQSRRQG